MAPSQDTSEYTPFDPCPDCSGNHLIAHETKSSDVYINEGDGQSVEFAPRGPGETQEVWCVSCDEKIWEREESEEPEYTINVLGDGGVLIKGDGNNRAISPVELDQLLNTDDPVTIR